VASCRARFGRATCRRSTRCSRSRTCGRALVPIHHGAFALSYEQLDEPARWLVELAKTRGVRDHVVVMAAGQSERFVSPAPSVDIDV
jgi:hypothetical protein